MSNADDGALEFATFVITEGLLLLFLRDTFVSSVFARVKAFESSGPVFLRNSQYVSLGFELGTISLSSSDVSIVVPANKEDNISSRSANAPFA